MTIAEMHIMFRQMSQQMGMQNVRAILPEQIDMLLNTSITDVVNEIIKNNISATNDRVATDNSKIGQINALSTLYKVKEINLTAVNEENTIMTKAIRGIDLSSNLDGYMFIVDFSLNYKVDNKDDSTTDYFPIRMIDDIYLADVLNDFILAPSFRSPVGIVRYELNKKLLDLYLERKRGKTFMINSNKLYPKVLRVSYVATPAEVKYLEDVSNSSNNVDCDLPAYLHADIVKRAVDLYNASLSGSLLSAQAVQRKQQQESMRNNYRQGDDSQQQQ